jgi:hypothetical protein
MWARCEDFQKVPIMLTLIDGGPTDNFDAIALEEVDGIGLGAVEVSGRDDFGATVSECEQQGDGFRLDVYARPNRESTERLSLREFFGDRLEQSTVPNYPLDARRHLILTTMMD